MVRRRGAGVLALVAAAGFGIATPAVAAEPPPTIEVIADGFDDPYGLAADGGKFYVAENVSGEITGIIPGREPSVRVSGFVGPSGVDKSDGQLFIVTGGSYDGSPGEGTATLYTSRPGVGPVELADLYDYELAENPDGQLQFGPDGASVETLSNPYSVLAGGDVPGAAFAYVADAGGNSVLAVDEDGVVSTFFAPPVVTTGLCEGGPNNDEGSMGCDPVPTGLAWGPDGNLYVATLGALVPGAGKVYVLDPCSGEVLDELTGFSGPTGVAVGDDGSVYVSEVLEGAPEGEEPPPPDFDPTEIGRIVKVDSEGERSVAQVTMPLGLTFVDGSLYSTAWSVASMLDATGAGQVVKVHDEAFTPEPVS